MSIKNFVGKLGLADKLITDGIKFGTEYVGNKVSASLCANSTEPGFYHIMKWLESVGYTAKTPHIKYGGSRVDMETSPADGTFFLKWRDKMLVLRVSSTDPSAFGEIAIFVKVHIVGGGRSDIDEIILEIKKLRENTAQTQIPIYTYDGWWRLCTLKDPRPKETLFYSENILSNLVDECRDFFTQKDAYQRKGIPWRRGYLLYGPPGNGKTSLVFGIASQLMLPIYVVNIMHSDSLSKVMLMIDEPCIVLIEELDTYTVSRTEEDKPIPTEKNPTLTTHKAFGDFLNGLDGMTAKEGVIMMATTNYREKLDPAVSRPGRFDRHVEIKNCTHELAMQMFLLHFPGEDPSEFAKKFIGDGLSVCTAQEMLLEMVSKRQT